MIRIDIIRGDLARIDAPAGLLARAGRLAALRAAEEWVDAVHEHIHGRRPFTPRTGHLEQSIGWRPDGDGALVYANAAYAADVELGTKPHLIRGKKRQAKTIHIKPTEYTRHGKLIQRRGYSYVSTTGALRWFNGGPGGGQMIRRAVKHPGTKPAPYFFADLAGRKARLLAVAREAVAEVLGAE